MRASSLEAVTSQDLSAPCPSPSLPCLPCKCSQWPLMPHPDCIPVHLCPQIDSSLRNCLPQTLHQPAACRWLGWTPARLENRRGCADGHVFCGASGGHADSGHHCPAWAAPDAPRYPWEVRLNLLPGLAGQDFMPSYGVEQVIAGCSLGWEWGWSGGWSRTKASWFLTLLHPDYTPGCLCLARRVFSGPSSPDLTPRCGVDWSSWGLFPRVWKCREATAASSKPAPPCLLANQHTRILCW